MSSPRDPGGASGSSPTAPAAGAHPDLGPLAAAYVLILAAFRPLAARLVQPWITAIAKRTST
ncbi:hypothetical protein AB0F17_60215 [Nonomuraea sp. NPDC026600]|uniref:hypothetical protein n=1 Tax=Nonomuraea sp. NPDC026600 TaxID=3155363 RepID=UPI0033E22CCF